MSLAADTRSFLASVLREAGPGQPTLCEGWTTDDLVAHLVVRETSPAALGIGLPALAPATRGAMRRLRTRRAYSGLVDRFAEGPGPLSPWRLLDEVANPVEFFVHAEDVRRASDPSAQPRTLDPRLEAFLWRRIGRMGRLLYRPAKVGVVLAREDATPPVVVRTARPVVTIVGPPGELVLHAYGRGMFARVRFEGSPEAIASLAATRLGF